MPTKNKFIFFCLIIALFLLSFNFVYAADDRKYAESANVKLQIPIFGEVTANNLQEYIATIYKYGVMVLVPVCIIMIIISGFKWILSAGNSSKIKEAKENIIQAFIGLFIGLFSYVILSSIGIGTLQGVNPEYIKSIPTDYINNETSSGDSCENPTAPGCSASSTSSSFLLHEAHAKTTTEQTFQDCIDNGRIVQGIPAEWNCPKCANVSELKQCCPLPIKTYPYANAGTICSSGCGITSLTMILNFYGKNTKIETVADMAKTAMYRNCPKCNCTTAGCTKGKGVCAADDCVGTKYDAFVSPKQSSADRAGKLTDYGMSQILTKYSLKGQMLTGIKDLDTKKSILTYLEAGKPIIISTTNPKVTGGGHFIVLIGCTDCFDDKKMKVFYRDPARYSKEPFTSKHNLFGTINSAFYISGGGGTADGGKCSAKNPCSSNMFCNDSGTCINRRKKGEICTRNEMCISFKCDIQNAKCLE